MHFTGIHLLCGADMCDFYMSDELSDCPYADMV